MNSLAQSTSCSVTRRVTLADLPGNAVKYWVETASASILPPLGVCAAAVAPARRAAAGGGGRRGGDGRRPGRAVSLASWKINGLARFPTASRTVLQSDDEEIAVRSIACCSTASNREFARTATPPRRLRARPATPRGAPPKSVRLSRRGVPPHRFPLTGPVRGARTVEVWVGVGGRAS